MAEKLRIGLIFGGRSGEHEVSLLSAHSVRSVLDPDIYQVTEIGITPEGMWLGGSAVLEAFENKQYDALSPVILLPEPRNATLYHLTLSPLGDILESLCPPGCNFPLIHGTFGEDGTLQGLLELADVAYVGWRCAGFISGYGQGTLQRGDAGKSNSRGRFTPGQPA